jgi:hypothetical protein
MQELGPLGQDLRGAIDDVRMVHGDLGRDQPSTIDMRKVLRGLSCALDKMEGALEHFNNRISTALSDSQSAGSSNENVLFDNDDSLYKDSPDDGPSNDTVSPNDNVSPNN